MKPGFVRIIAGKWRGRRLKILDVPDLRPTPDRVRETVFNWLAPHIVSARCLDLFAGTGAFGFEALSRGAEYVEMIDQSKEVVTVLQQELHKFEANNALICRKTIPLDLTKSESEPFNIVFIDPPYASNLLFKTCNFLEQNGFLAELSYIYLEAHALITDNELPKNWRILKSQRAGVVFYHLAQRNKNER